MSTDEAVLYESAAPVARLTIDRADRRNAINSEVVAGLSTGLRRAEDDDAIKLLVVTGVGDKAFCAGGDLGDAADASRVAQHFIREDVGELFKAMRRSRLPIVARVNGHALAGGFGLMLACDLVVAADDIEVGTPEVNLGLWPFMISAVIRRDVPRKIALEMMLTGRRMGVDEAHRWGFVNRVVPRATLDDAIAETAEILAAKSPLILSLGKRSFYSAEDLDFEHALEYLAGMLTLCLESEDTVEGVTAFLQKRAPEWKGR